MQKNYWDSLKLLKCNEQNGYKSNNCSKPGRMIWLCFIKIPEQQIFANLYQPSSTLSLIYVCIYSSSEYSQMSINLNLIQRDWTRFIFYGFFCMTRCWWLLQIMENNYIQKQSRIKNNPTLLLMGEVMRKFIVGVEW